MGACFRCEANDHFMHKCLKATEKKDDRCIKPLTTPQKGKHLSQSINTGGNRGDVKDMIVKSEARAPTWTYFI